MEQTLGAWVAPILMIPGMALLVISTGNRFSQLLVHLAKDPEEPRLNRQLRSLRFALLALYTGIAAHALAGLLGGLLYLDVEASRALMLAFSCVGVTCLVIAAILLALEALRDPFTPKDPRG